MSFYTRLTRPVADEPKIPIHTFCAMLNEYKKGFVTGPEMISMFNITQEELADANWLMGKVNNANSIEAFLRELRDILYLAESRTAYTTQAEFVARINASVA